MPWAGGNYTKGNNGTGGWTGDASLGIGIEAGRHDTQDNDFAAGINQCLNKDGSNAATGNLNLGGFRPTNVAAGTEGAPAYCPGNDADTGMWLGAANQLAFSTGGVERFRIDSSGEAGFGTPSPLTRISVVGINVAGGVSDSGSKTATLRVSDANGGVGDGGVIEFGAGYGSYAQSYFSAIKGLLGDGSGNTTGDLAFYTRNATSDTSLAERMRITSAGRVGIGSTNPTYTVQIINTDATAIGPLQVNNQVANDQATAALVLIKNSNVTNTTQVLAQFYANNSAQQMGQINGNGANQAAFGSISDARRKENITDLPSQLSNIMSLRPVEFDYKDGSGHQVGFIAQEVQAIYPDLVGEGSDGFYTLTGLGKNEARMIKAIQELSAKVESLEAQVAALEA